MYGSAIKADILLEPDVDEYDSYFPSDLWLSLRYQLIRKSKSGKVPYIKKLSGNNNDLNLF
jgi:hypothetical protein